MTLESYCRTRARAHAPDSYLQALCLPADLRDAALALLALDAELAQARLAACEPMLAALRYAWWQESIDALYAGKPTPGQPVLEALSAALPPRPEMDALIEAHRADENAEAALEAVLAALAGKSTVWKKAGRVIAAHRARHPRGRNAFLVMKLLLLR